MNWMYSLLNSDVINTYSYVVSGSGVETPWWIYLLLILDRGFRIGVIVIAAYLIGKAVQSLKKVIYNN